MKEFTIQFKGNKEELRTQLKAWCDEADRTMNGTIIELIQKHLKKQNEKQNNQTPLSQK